MSRAKCGRCGKDPAEGFATINGVRYCHEGPDPTCYMLGPPGKAAFGRFLEEMAELGWTIRVADAAEPFTFDRSTEPPPGLLGEQP